MTLIGATGGTGLEIVRQAVARGIEVTAIVRSPEKLGDLAGSMTVRRGDPVDVATLAESLEGCDAAVSAIGAKAGFGKKGATTIYSRAATALVHALAESAAVRLLFLTSAGVEPRDPGEIAPYKWIAKPLFLQRGYDDMTDAERIIRRSTAEWTLVRPSRLTDGPLTRSYRVSPHYRSPGGTKISRADTADFILDELSAGHWIRATPTLTY